MDMFLKLKNTTVHIQHLKKTLVVAISLPLFTGSYDCPQVWTLRRFRDYTLAETWYGRTFIRTYYAISPTLVKWFGHTEWFKKCGKADLIEWLPI